MLLPVSQPIEKAAAALVQTTGLQSTGRTSHPPGLGVSLEIRSDDGRSYVLPCEVKAVIDRRDQLLAFKARHDGVVLITRSLSSVMAAHCRELGIQFIDHAGNCYLRQPGLFVFVSGARAKTQEKQASVRGLTPSALLVVFAVLTRPEILHDNVRRIAKVASISHGAAGGALVMLEELGFLANSGTGRRMLATPQRWLDAWTEGYLGRIRPKLEKIRMSAADPATLLLDRINPRMRELALGGEAAALYRNLGLKPGRLTLYLDFHEPQVLRHLVQDLKLRRDPTGAIELVSMFWNTSEMPCFPTVPDALIYADLIATGDERNLEAAHILRKEICTHVENTA